MVGHVCVRAFEKSVNCVKFVYRTIGCSLLTMTLLLLYYICECVCVRVCVWGYTIKSKQQKAVTNHSSTGTSHFGKVVENGATRGA